MLSACKPEHLTASVRRMRLVEQLMPSWGAQDSGAQDKRSCMRFADMVTACRLLICGCAAELDQ